jgi:peptidoglycan DL-endopeptidase CwlO
LSTLVSSTSCAVTDHVGAIGRGGVVIAMSSGLVASMGLPAGAAPADTSGRTASLPVLPAAPATGSFLALPADLDDDLPVTASLAASVSFDGGAFRATPQAPKPKPAPVVVQRVARSATRTALATTTHRSTTTTKTTQVTGTPSGGGFGSARGSSVVAIASRYLGVPYVYGGESPNGFDCSGLVQYVFGQLGVHVPRTAQQQYNAVSHISRSQAHAGDLVFFGSSGGIYHVGIYLGGNMMLDAPHSGTVVQKREIWSASVTFGRP